MSAAVSTTPLPSPVKWTIRELLNWTTTYLGQKKVDSPRLDAHILLAHVLQCPRIELIARSDEEPTPKQKTTYRELIQRRVDGWPVAYLTGTKEFYLLPFAVSPAVLIPRPDTETLVLEALNRLKGKTNQTVLDLGTGSGCIAISIAVNCPTARITAIDLSPDAADIARQNAKTHGVADRVNVMVGDLTSPLAADSTFDLVTSNPPYIAQSEIANLATDVRDHEPRMALDGGPDGLAFYRRISASAPPLLRSGGSLLLEVGHKQAGSVVELMSQQTAFEPAVTIRDAGRIERVVVAKRK